ncbi:MAG: hypothetical protein IPG10_07340 [Flavobacteriales bacterium]|nr:hypothetical protein [Flavobacteriales bacterium]
MRAIACSLLCLGMGWGADCVAQQPGELDTTFADQGKLVITTLGPVTDIQVDDLGRIYALSSSNGVWALMRLSSSGELDTNFADQGILSSTTALIRVLVQSDRRLILLSGQGGAGVIRRFDENGAPDTTYATLGQFVLPPATSIHDGDLLANDELLICGDSATTWSSVYRAFVILWIWTGIWILDSPMTVG